MADLEQTGNLSCLININSLSSRYFRETRHSHDLTGKCYDESCSGRNLQISYRNFKVCRSSQFCLVICQTVLRLGNTDRTVAESLSLQLLGLFLSIGRKDNAFSAIYLLYDLVQFILNASIQFSLRRLLPILRTGLRLRPALYISALPGQALPWYLLGMH